MDTKSLLIGVLIGAVLFGGGAFVLTDSVLSNNGDNMNDANNSTEDQSRYKNFTQSDKNRIFGPYADNTSTDTSYVTVTVQGPTYIVKGNEQVSKIYTASERSDLLVEFEKERTAYIPKNTFEIGVVVETKGGQRYVSAVLPPAE